MTPVCKHIAFTVKAEDDGMRIDRFLAGHMPEMTRSRIQKLIEEGCVLSDNSAVKASYKVKVDGKISVSVPELKEPPIMAEDIPLSIVYEDDDMLVVNKPQGMVVHPAAGNYSGTLVNALMAHCGTSLSGINGEKRPGILHRIDKDTSGLLLVAKNDVAHQSLAAQIKAHSLTRAYQALVHGGFSADTGTVNMPIGRSPVNRKKMAVTMQHSREAVTHYRVLERLEAYTLIECVLETGRTHQIRVHMSKIGHPIVGDPLYGVKKEAFSLNGQLLHAYKVGFIHPRTAEYMEFTSPLPDYFQKILKNLRNL
ncbi:RluA family pseudouridine synthase [Ructibacterium gallinarum]|uniref:Pseudouridine synthase n=1 Tax=Ructibacterium gallinarum TaxID=2779355 RepID=A0A9D5R9D7_9FIRM|nr:RluA family pseudouridine synthase [Ructibacterium gallinarum]